MREAIQGGGGMGGSKGLINYLHIKLLNIMFRYSGVDAMFFTGGGGYTNNGLK